MDIGAIVETKVDVALNEGHAAGIALKDAILEAWDKLVKALLNIYYGLFGVAAY